MRNGLLLVLVLMVVAVTALNSYTTRLCNQYFLDATLVSNREDARQAQLSYLQDTVAYAQQSVHDEAKIALGFRDERDCAIGAYNELYDQAIGMYQTMKDMERYIQLLISALTNFGFDVPKPDLNTFPPSDWGPPEHHDFKHNPAASRSTGEAPHYTICHMTLEDRWTPEEKAHAVPMQLIYSERD